MCSERHVNFGQVQFDAGVNDVYGRILGKSNTVQGERHWCHSVFNYQSWPGNILVTEIFAKIDQTNKDFGDV